MLISIVTPCFNSARFIRECLESVLAQDYPMVEHIIQDGASTDGTVEIIQEYAEKYPRRIRFRSAPDRGQADGLNRAIQRARGDALLALNADDALLPKACSWAVENLAKFPEAGAIYGDEYLMNENGQIIDKFLAPPYNFGKLLCLELVPPAQASFIRRRALEQVGFYADKYLDSCPDFEMWVRLGLEFPIKHVPDFVSCYRHLSGNLFEGGIPKTAKRFYEAKKMVLERVFNSPRTSPRIRALRDRAQVGLLFWAAAAHYGLTGNWRSIVWNKFLYQSFWLALRRGYWAWFLSNVYLYGRLLIKRLIYGRG
ncbi:MAG: glycosyltransferase [Candidatus Vogelbacteria bacterium]|nr:glycosyltransferase [Candidatus Vogelbacteria bacterium]